MQLNELLISSDKSKLQFDVIFNYLKNESYWGKEKTIEIVKTSIENSVCFGIYKNGNQIGFTRVVTDISVFAYLCDVFILPKFQGQGIGKYFLKNILEDKMFEQINTWFLVTDDAQKFYNKFVKNCLKFHISFIYDPFLTIMILIKHKMHYLFNNY